VFDRAMPNHLVIQVPADLVLTFFKRTDAGAVAVAEALPFVVPDEGDFSVLYFRDRRDLRTFEHLLPGTVFVTEPRPDDPDDLAEFEDRIARASERQDMRKGPTRWM
jgi:hypothetical protein